MFEIPGVTVTMLFTITISLMLVLEMIYICAARKNPQLIFRNNLFKMHYKGKDRTYWECISRSKVKCRARIATTGSVLVVKEANHNHVDLTEFPPVLTTKYVSVHS